MASFKAGTGWSEVRRWAADASETAAGAEVVGAGATALAVDLRDLEGAADMRY